MCVILCTNVNGTQILAKNRDRTYKPSIEIIHEIVNGIEVAYIRDKDSGWIEGMNEYGTGIINSTLNNQDGYISKKIATKENIIYKILIEKHLFENFYDIINDPKNKYAMEGHTILFFNNELIHFENNIQNEYITERINNNSVYTNHGINLKGEGYTKCNKGMSSFLRRAIIKKELGDNKIESIEQLSDIMNTNYTNINPRFHPYRNKNYSKKKNKRSGVRFNINTTGQLLFNMTNMEFNYCPDRNTSERVKYINRLPNEYMPKIKIYIREIQKNIKHKKKLFTKKYLSKIEKRYRCKAKNINTKLKRKTRRKIN